LFKAAVTKSEFMSTRPSQDSEYGVAQPWSVNDLLIIRNRPLIYSRSGSHSSARRAALSMYRRGSCRAGVVRAGTSRHRWAAREQRSTSQQAGRLGGLQMSRSFGCSRARWSSASAANSRVAARATSSPFREGRARGIVPRRHRGDRFRRTSARGLPEFLFLERLANGHTLSMCRTCDMDGPVRDDTG
jgi:hypothetical protein